MKHPVRLCHLPIEMLSQVIVQQLAMICSDEVALLLNGIYFTSYRVPIDILIPMEQSVTACNGMQ